MRVCYLIQIAYYTTYNNNEQYFVKRINFSTYSYVSREICPLWILMISIYMCSSFPPYTRFLLSFVFPCVWFIDRLRQFIRHTYTLYIGDVHLIMRKPLLHLRSTVDLSGDMIYMVWRLLSGRFYFLTMILPPPHENIQNNSRRVSLFVQQTKHNNNPTHDKHYTAVLQIAFLVHLFLYSCVFLLFLDHTRSLALSSCLHRERKQYFLGFSIYFTRRIQYVCTVCTGLSRRLLQKQ